jgi:threonine synthase
MDRNWVILETGTAVDPHTAAAVEAYRRDREQRLRTNGVNA